MRMACAVDANDVKELLDIEWPAEAYNFAESKESILAADVEGGIAVIGDLMKYRDNKLVDKITCVSATIRKYIKEGNLEDGQVVTCK